MIELVRSNRGSYFPLVQYSSKNGQNFVYQSKTESDPPSYKLNEKVTVYYSQKNPEIAMISGFFSLYAEAFVLGLFGSIFFIAGCAGMIYRYVLKRKEKYFRGFGIFILSMKKVSFTEYLILTVGVVLLILALSSLNRTYSHIDNAIQVEGTVIELVLSSKGAYYPLVQYSSKNGQNFVYQSKTGSDPPSYKLNEKVTVYYSQKNPEIAKISGFFSLYGEAFFWGLFGSIISIAGCAGMIYRYVLKRKEKHFRTYGTSISTLYKYTKINNTLEINDSRPYRIFSQWQDPATLKVYIFKSQNIWFDPSKLIDREQITVFIKNDNPKKYFMDISFLPELPE